MDERDSAKIIGILLSEEKEAARETSLRREACLQLADNLTKLASALRGQYMPDLKVCHHMAPEVQRTIEHYHDAQRRWQDLLDRKDRVGCR
jgi:hypothetical protein